MTDSLAIRCPRCKLTLTGSDEDTLADTMLAHVGSEHGHQPPREHVIGRIRRHNPEAPASA